MTRLAKLTVVAAATAATLFMIQPLQAVTAVVPHSVILNQVDQASTNLVQHVRRGGRGGGFGRGGFSRGGGAYWRRGGINRGWRFRYFLFSAGLFGDR